VRGRIVEVREVDGRAQLSPSSLEADTNSWWYGGARSLETKYTSSGPSLARVMVGTQSSMSTPGAALVTARSSATLQLSPSTECEWRTCA